MTGSDEKLKCFFCGTDHLEVIERITRLETQQNAAREALAKAEQEDRIQFQHLNKLRREVVEDRELFVTKELFEKEVAIVRGFVRGQITLWTLVAGSGIAAMILLLRIIGH